MPADVIQKVVDAATVTELTLTAKGVTFGSGGTGKMTFIVVATTISASALHVALQISPDAGTTWADILAEGASLSTTATLAATNSTTTSSNRLTPSGGIINANTPVYTVVMAPVLSTGPQAPIFRILAATVAAATDVFSVWVIG